MNFIALHNSFLSFGIKKLFTVCLIIFITVGCSVNKNSLSADKKYSAAQLQKDFKIYTTVLKEHHPGLYWYTAKDSMNFYFDATAQLLKDSMAEPDFRKLLSRINSKIGCGHSAVRASKKYAKYVDSTKLTGIFPLSLKLWQDTMVVTTNLNRNDSVLKRGTVITAIDGRNASELRDSLFSYLPTDGYNSTHKYQSLSNRGFFGAIYSTVFGQSDFYDIKYLDGAGNEKQIRISLFKPILDTQTKKTFRQTTAVPKPAPARETKVDPLNGVRFLQIDTAYHRAFMTLGSFGKGYRLQQFFRHTFKTLRKRKIQELIIDVRSNGGGSVNNSTKLTRYIATQKFRLADSLYAISRKGSTTDKYIKGHFFIKLFIGMFTKRKSDQNYHFGYFERHYFKPKKKNHFDGDVYVLTGGNSFSATTLFALAVKDQNNVTLVGEETGGGAYGNSAWLTPEVTLPETGVRIRLPLFRLVTNKSIPKNGKGVQPEVEVLPTVDAIRNNKDYKLEKVRELIEKKRTEKQQLP